MLAPYSASHNANAASMASSAYGPPVSHTPDGTARALESQTKAYRNRYAEPIGGDNYPNASPGDLIALRNNGLPSHYNVDPAPPTKYTQDSAAKEHFRDKETIIAGINAEHEKEGQKVQRVVHVGEEEVELMREARRTSELANFDTYVYSMVDPRQPGALKWLNEVYPDFVARRIEQVQTDYEFALRNQLIDQWGINDFQDLKFKYMVDQGLISGPSLEQPPRPKINYTPGYLSPWKFPHWLNTDKEKLGLKLPFASANYGKRPTAVDNWSFTPKTGTLQGDRSSFEYAKALYRTDASRGNYDIGRPDFTPKAAAAPTGAETEG